MRVDGNGFTVITARGHVPLPMVARPTGRTLDTDLARKAKKMTGFDWPKAEAQIAEPTPVLPPKPKRRSPGPAPVRPARPIPSTAAVDAMEAAYRAGKPLSVVAKEAGFARSTVAKYLRARGVEILPPGNNLRYRTPVVLADKVCSLPTCGKTYSYTPGDRVQSFKLRTTCSSACAGALSALRRRGKSQKEKP